MLTQSVPNIIININYHNRKSEAIILSLGLPEILVTDNGSTFTSDEFEDFLKKNGIDRHKKTPPYY